MDFQTSSYDEEDADTDQTIEVNGGEATDEDNLFSQFGVDERLI